MMRNLIWMFLLFLTVSLWAVEGDEVENHDPMVTNVVAKQIEQRVEITYDLDDADGDLMTVELLASSDGGKNFDLPVKSVEGEIGKGIASGKGKTIIWHVEQDVPDFYSTNVVFEVVADDGVGPLIWEKDGSEMMLIPSGSFEMGDSKNEPDDWMRRSRPVHRVELDAFYMDVHEVTVGQFEQFVNQSGYQWGNEQTTWDNVANYSPGDEYPMVYVSWNDATAYAKWAGKRLPTEAEWEYAARGGLAGKRYPWGDDGSLARDYANYEWTGGKDKWDESTARGGSFKPNGYGLYDMAGNIREWCQDWYGSDYYSNSPTKNPPGRGTGSNRVLRGGSWYDNTGNLRVAYRFNRPPFFRSNFYGFRCVVSGSN